LNVLRIEGIVPVEALRTELCRVNGNHRVVPAVSSPHNSLSVAAWAPGDTCTGIDPRHHGLEPAIVSPLSGKGQSARKSVGWIDQRRVDRRLPVVLLRARCVDLEIGCGRHGKPWPNLILVPS